MPKKEKIVLVGGGGHCKVIIDAIKSSNKFIIYGIVDPNLPKGELILGTRVIGGDNILPQVLRQGVKNAFISIGSLGDCSIRKKIYNDLKSAGFEFPVILHQKAVIAREVQFDEGVFVAAGAVINSGTKIGKNVIVNTSSSIDHDCVIGDFAHIAPGATLSGGVNIGSFTHVGIGALVNQYIHIGNNCLIGSGSVVVHNIEDNVKAFGNPCKVIGKIDA